MLYLLDRFISLTKDAGSIMSTFSSSEDSSLGKTSRSGMGLVGSLLLRTHIGGGHTGTAFYNGRADSLPHNGATMSVAPLTTVSVADS